MSAVRALLARALVNRPTVLILDEPTSGLDIRGREELLSVLEDLSTQADRPALVMITHHVEELPRATTNVLLLDDGHAAGQGRPAEVLTSERLTRVYGCPVELRETDGRYFPARRHARLAGVTVARGCRRSYDAADGYTRSVHQA